MDETTFKKIARIVLLLWFFVIALVVLIPSSRLLLGTGGAIQPREVPQPPEPPAIKEVTWIDPQESAAILSQRVDTYKQQVLLYTQMVQAYGTKVTAYGKYLDEKAKGGCDKCPPQPVEAYSLVVKETVAPMVNSFLAALLAYVFVNGGTQLLNNYLRLKRGQEIERIALV